MKTKCKIKAHSWTVKLEGYNTLHEVTIILTALNGAGICYRIINSTRCHVWHFSPYATELDYQHGINTPFVPAIHNWSDLISDQTGEVLASAGDTIKILAYKNAREIHWCER